MVRFFLYCSGACNLLLLCLCSRYHQAQCVSLRLPRPIAITSATKEVKPLLKRLWRIVGSSSRLSSHSSGLCSSVPSKLRKLGICGGTVEERKYYSSCASTPRRSPTSSIFFFIQNKYCFHEITTSAFVYPRRCTNDAPAVGAALQIGRGGDTTHRGKKHARRAGRQQVWESFLQIFIPEYRNKNKICSKGLLKRVKIFLELLLHRKIEEDAGEGVALVDIDHHLRVKHRPGELLYRIQKELKDFISNPPNGCSVAVSKNMKVWIITITGLDGSVYGGERFRLRVAFPSNYPSRPPSVYFLQTPPPPKHEHVYTNGDICLSLLGKDWKPNLTISGLTISIVSMLNSATEKRRPQDNAAHAKSKPGGPQTNWVYHDQRS